jgi:hypothetical protein
MSKLMLEMRAHSIDGFPVRPDRATAFGTAHLQAGLRHCLIDTKTDPFAVRLDFARHAERFGHSRNMIGGPSGDQPQ